MSTRLWIGDMPLPEDEKLGLDANGNPVYTDGTALKVMTEVKGVRDITLNPSPQDAAAPGPKVRDLGLMGNIIGVGYEGLDLDRLVSKLRLRDITTVVDVRLNPISRKRGLSKTALSNRLAAEGITYEHHPTLGNPRDNREGFADTDTNHGRQARDRFDELLDTPGARGSLDRILELADEGRVALLCFEEDETRCHRELVLNALRDRLVQV